MISISARQSRLARHIVVSRCHCRPRLLARRGLATSISRWNNGASSSEAVSNNTQAKPADLSNDKTSSNIARQSAASSDGKPKSRLSALKKKSTKGPREESKGEKYIFGKSTDIPIRTRFAPSPTGYLHLGSLRTALFNNLLAKATKGGEFIIRIEDTDQNRIVPDAEQRVFEDLRWAGLEWTEGPDKGGPYGPYRQSERLETYHHHTQTLLDNGTAYRCFCTPATLEAHTRAAHDAGRPTVYPGTCRAVPRAESDARAAKGEPHVVRLNAGLFGTPGFQDAIYGPIQKKLGEEDFVLMKTDGFPTYHLANVVDDHLMKITHVVRGEEWLISTPKHIALYQAFGWKPPTFAHLALLVEQDGSKLSKRNASVNLSTYQAKHIFPIALQAWLANLGSSFRNKVPTPRSMKDVADALTFKFTRGGIKLNHEKLTYFQNAYRQLLFSTPSQDLTPSETSLIHTSLVLPLINEVLSITSSATPPPIRPENASLPWSGPLDLIPAMQAPEDIRAAYVFGLLNQGGAKFESSQDLATLQPYLFWRPPLTVYRASLVSHPVSTALLSTVHQAIHASPAEFSAAQDTLKALVGADDMPAVHALIRLILIGDADAFSRNSSLMFKLLGQEECKHRADVVKALVDELQAGGEELKRRWTEEGKAMAR